MRRFDERVRKTVEGPVGYQAEPKLDGSSLKLVCVEGVLDRADTQGNVIGSNIFSPTAVPGAATVKEPLSIASGVLRCEFPAMFILSALAWPMAGLATARRW